MAACDRELGDDWRRASADPEANHGRIKPALVQASVRARFDALRGCYERGLAEDPKLQGRVVVRFVIDPNGRVESARDDGSDLPSKAVVECVVAGFSTLRFPKPEGRRVTAVYPIVFKPAEDAPPTARDAGVAARPVSPNQGRELPQ